MAAHDNLSQQLFHGTHVKLNPGDIIKPRGQVEDGVGNYGTNPTYGEDVGEHAYAVNDKGEAEWFANESVRHHGGEPHVYEVKRLGRTKSRPLYNRRRKNLPQEAYGIKEHLSKQGFRVIGRA